MEDNLKGLSDWEIEEGLKNSGGWHDENESFPESMKNILADKSLLC